MQFKVPQFIEREAKIIGPLTFKQFLFIGGGGVLIFILYSTLASINFTLFLMITMVIGLMAFSFALLKVEGHPMLSVFAGLINFLSSPRIYLWERKKGASLPPKIKPTTSQKTIPEEKKPASDIKIFKQSKLKDLSSQIEIEE